MRCTLNSAQLALFVSLVVPCAAHAAGFEDTISGTINLGRAANALRVQDFMATWGNPANLAVLPRNDLGGELRVPFLQACFDRAKDNSAMYRVNDPARGLFGSESFSNVCNDGNSSRQLSTAHSAAVMVQLSHWRHPLAAMTPQAVFRCAA
ncbi:MAG TPA: hypothetical protein VJV78_26745 [Polyangiales bacterium]|nr:hypothetical protein [Polyangiales bacterium]